VLEKLLGSWLQSPPQWRWWFSPSDEQLYSVTLSATTYYAPIARNYHHTRAHCYGLQTSATLPADAFPTTVIIQPDQTLCIEGHYPVQAQEEAPDPGGPWWGHPFDLKGTFEDLVLGIQRGTAVAITDGSFK
jgi:hypothetical protein